jgi:hypothetical protein
MNWATFEASKVTIKVILGVGVLAYTCCQKMNIRAVRVMREKNKKSDKQSKYVHATKEFTEYKHIKKDQR